MNDKAKSIEAAGSEVQGAIEAFQQILDAMPTDRVALQALYEAYEQIGDSQRTLEYLVRLCNVIADENDQEAALMIYDKLKELGTGHNEAETALDRLSALVTGEAMPVANAGGGAPAAKTKGGKPVKKRKVGDITAAMACAWNLLQAEVLTQDDYAQVVDDLSESSSKVLDVPVSVLHVLTDRGATNIEKIMAFLAKDTGVPVISIKSFDMQMEAATILPLDFIQHNAALPFDFMGNDLLLAVLNPYDKELMQIVEGMTGRKCHFYLVTSTEYDQSLDAIQSHLKSLEGEGKK